MRCAVVILLLLLASVAAAVADNPTQRVSVDSAGNQVYTGSGSLFHSPALSADGRIVVFESAASTLVPDDTNGVADVFWRNRTAAQTLRLSVNSAGQQANGRSFAPAVSGDGRAVVFESLASNLAGGDTNGASDIFLYNAPTGSVSAISVAPAGATGDSASSFPSISRDGQFAAFCSRASNLIPDDTNGTPGVFVRDLAKGETSRVSLSDPPKAGQTSGECSHTALSADGRFVAFQSAAAGLVEGDTNGVADVFVRDRQAGRTTRVSVSSSGGQADGYSGSSAVAISDGGRFVAFDSAATDLVPDDTNGAADVFVHDMQAGETKRISVSSGGAQGSGDSGLGGVAISGDGRLVAFESRAPDLVPGDTNGKGDIFVHDISAGATSLVSIAFDGSPATNFSYSPGINGDGSVVAFTSLANNLIVGDRNDQPDVYVRDGSFAASVDVHPAAPAASPATEPPGAVTRPADDGGAGLPAAAYAGMAAAAAAVIALAGRWLVRRRRRAGPIR